MIFMFFFSAAKKEPKKPPRIPTAFFARTSYASPAAKNAVRTIRGRQRAVLHSIKI